MHVVLIGATGVTGKAVFGKMLENKLVSKVTLIGRRKIPDALKKSAAAKSSDSTLTQTQIEQMVFPSLGSEHLQTLSLEADVFICCLGTTIKSAGSKKAFERIDLELVYAFGELAKRGNCKAFFVVSAKGANEKSLIHYSRVKGSVEKLLRSLHLNSLYILRPGLLIAERSESRPLEFLGVKTFRALKLVLPQNLMSKMGTYPEEIADYISRKMECPEKGVHEVEHF